MQEIWDSYWNGAKTLKIEQIIQCDSIYRLLKKLISIPKDIRQIDILEVGCGSGIRSLALLKDFNTYVLNATLVDSSPNALALAQNNADENRIAANFVKADALSLPFPDESFDIVWNAGVNEHFEGEKRQFIFDEMARVCKRTGQVIVIVPNASNFPYRLWKKVLETQKRWVYGCEKPFTIFELKSKLRKAGLIPKKIGGTGVLSPMLRLAEIIPRKSVMNPNKAKSTAKQSESTGGLGKIFYWGEIFSESVMWFAGGNIGVKGIKDSLS
jgi:ubiquinone/menaquinone biosynthesis C-methylase UbiE